MALFQKCLNLFLPNQCLGCHRFLESKIPLCPNCAKKLIPNFSFYCPTCHKRLPYGHLQCSTHNESSLKTIACLFDWREPLVQELILNFKYHNLVPLKDVFQIYLASFFSHHLNILSECHYSIIPIPLSPQKLKQRGFNQSEIILPHSFYSILPIVTDNLIRVKNNAPQALTVSPSERLENILGVFDIKNSSAIVNKNFILVDDVYTTGATLNEAAKTLKENGAKNIVGVTLAGQIY